MHARLLRVPALIVVLTALVGCSHRLDVKNLRAYRSMDMSPLAKRCTVGLIAATDDMEGRRLVKSVGTALATESAIVLLPYLPNGERKADVVAKISLQPEFKGSGWNFLINWPGFLIWAPAWHGYVYKADFSADVLLTKGADSTKIDSWRIPIELNIRQAAINRTWTEIGWLEWGVIPLVGGICFIQYDESVTVPLMEKVERTLGEHIAHQIIARVNSSGVLTAK
jgi:hypothetical protein